MKLTLQLRSYARVENHPPFRSTLFTTFTIGSLKTKFNSFTYSRWSPRLRRQVQQTTTFSTHLYIFKPKAKTTLLGGSVFGGGGSNPYLLIQTKKQQTPERISVIFGGEQGIRTLETVLAVYTISNRAPSTSSDNSPSVQRIYILNSAPLTKCFAIIHN